MFSAHSDSFGKAIQVDVMESYDTELIDLDSLSEEEFKVLKENSRQNEKLFLLLEREILKQEELLNLSRKELRNVMHHTIYWLMRYNALTIKEVLAFSDQQYEIFSSICVKNDTKGFVKIIAKLHALTEHQVKVLKSPNVAWLLRCKTMEPDEVFQISEDLLTAFDELNFSKKEMFYSEHELLVCQLKFFMSYFFKGLLPVKELLALEDDKQNNVMINLGVTRLKEFLINGAITWDYLTEIAPSVLIESLPEHVVTAINKKTINLADELAARIRIFASQKMNVSQAIRGEDYIYRADADKVMNFIKIYNALRVGQSSFFKKSDWVKDNKIAELPPAVALAMITEHAKNKNTRTHAAFELMALSDDKQALAKNVYLYAFQKSHIFKKSNAFGQTFYSASALQKYLVENPQLVPVEVGDNTRMNKISQALR
jgi:hypothetical protein